MKKMLSLLLALTLVFAMAAPASAANYYGRFSRDGTYNNIAYLISATCNTYDARASISYADPDSAVALTLTVYLPGGAGSSAWSGEQDGYCSIEQEFDVSIQKIHATFKILGTQIGAATVKPG